MCAWFGDSPIVVAASAEVETLVADLTRARV